jgi:hypothetical protein
MHSLEALKFDLYIIKKKIVFYFYTRRIFGHGIKILDM